MYVCICGPVYYLCLSALCNLFNGYYSTQDLEYTFLKVWYFLKSVIASGLNQWFSCSRLLCVLATEVTPLNLAHIR